MRSYVGTWRVSNPCRDDVFHWYERKGKHLWIYLSPWWLLMLNWWRNYGELNLPSSSSSCVVMKLYGATLIQLFSLFWKKIHQFFFFRRGLDFQDLLEVRGRRREWNEDLLAHTVGGDDKVWNKVIVLFTGTVLPIWIKPFKISWSIKRK